MTELLEKTTNNKKQQQQQQHWFSCWDYNHVTDIDNLTSQKVKIKKNDFHGEVIIMLYTDGFKTIIKK